MAVKRLDRLLQAVALLGERRPGLRVSLVGDGVLRRALEQQAERLGLQGRVRFEGARPFEEVVRWLRRARLLVMTSQMEGLPQAMIEAMSCGVPVVISATGDVTTLARHGENAWVVPEPTAEVADKGRLHDGLPGSDFVLHHQVVLLRIAGANSPIRKAFAGISKRSPSRSDKRARSAPARDAACTF